MVSRSGEPKSGNRVYMHCSYLISLANSAARIAGRGHAEERVKTIPTLTRAAAFIADTSAEVYSTTALINSARRTLWLKSWRPPFWPSPGRNYSWGLYKITLWPSGMAARCPWNRSRNCFAVAQSSLLHRRRQTNPVGITGVMKLPLVSSLKHEGAKSCREGPKVILSSYSVQRCPSPVRQRHNHGIS